ncbi:MAG TPA: hypothetical protein VNS63_15445 [Blastocatellia bacterium]|nr:hypothetical protein [Blastocatellia bacterium]
MKKIVLILFAFCVLVSTTVRASAQAPAGPPAVLHIVREDIKTGMMEAHSREANATVRIWAKAKSPHQRLAMVPIAGNQNEVTYLWPFPSFAAYEKAQKDLDKIGETFKADFDRTRHAGEDYHSAQRDMLCRLRADLSYNLPAGDRAKMRFMRVETIRVKPGHISEFEEQRKIVAAAHVKAKVDEHMAVYQVVGGAQAGTFIVLVPWTSMDDSNLLPHGKAYQDALGEDGNKKIAGIANDAILSDDVSIYAMDPQLSYLLPATVASDPEFWRLKPQAQVVAKKKVAAKVEEKKQ